MIEVITAPKPGGLLAKIGSLKMLTQNDFFAKVFVTTYAVGNTQGFAVGKWFDLTDYADKEDFINDATQYAKSVLNDDDPELCFSDYELSLSVDGLMSEYGINKIVWDFIELDEAEKEVLEAYINAFGVTDIEDVTELLRQANDRYRGNYEDDEALALELLTEDGTLDSLPTVIESSLNWQYLGEYYGQDYLSYNGYYFWAHV